MTSEPFIGYPEEQVLASFTSRAEVARALDEAREAGIPESGLAIYSGEEGEEALDSDGTQHGISGVIVRGLQFLMTDRDRLAEYVEALEHGGIVLAARVDDDEQKQEMSAVFQRNGGQNVRYYGKFTVEELSVDPSLTRMD